MPSAAVTIAVYLHGELIADADFARGDAPEPLGGSRHLAAVHSNRHLFRCLDCKRHQPGDLDLRHSGDRHHRRPGGTATGVTAGGPITITASFAQTGTTVTATRAARCDGSSTKCPRRPTPTRPLPAR